MPVMLEPAALRSRVKHSTTEPLCSLLTSYNVNDRTEHAPRDDNGNVTLMAQGDMQDFI